MWGHNRPASEEPAESPNLWLQVLCSDLQNAAVRLLGGGTMEKEPQAPEGDKCAWGRRGGEGS
jgi:hypothetical protein